jgi:threonine/homoserine/homoserine lactone efflux protein
MIPLETLIPYVAASTLLALAPGPDNIFVLTQSALRGRNAGLIVMLGLCTGLIVHSLAVALGVAVIFQTSAVAFSALKFIGAAYLAWLAWQAFHATAENIQGAAGTEVKPWQLYRRGIIMNITNPKVSIFFLAFLPQFADPARGPLSLQLLLLGGLVLTGSLGQWLNRSARAQTIMHKIAGTVFLGLALKLALSNR